jgi:hypothetical protein
MKCLNFSSPKQWLWGFALVSVLAPSLVHSAWVHFDPADTTQVPKLFSQTGFYSNMTAKTVTAEAVPYEVNSALWSDHAHKSRWILLKPGAEKIGFDPAKDYFEYPNGAVFVKLFKQDTVYGDTTSRIYWETRVLVNKKRTDTLSVDPLGLAVRDEWVPFSYRWKADGSDAELVPMGSGAVASMNLLVNGQQTFRKWVFPNTQGCNNCHRQFYNGTQGRTVLGFFTAQINRPMLDNPSVNQIQNLFTKNIFSATPVPTPAQIAALPKWAAIDDTTADLDLRAKAYIASNCSGCHGTRGIATDAIYLAGEHVNYDFLPSATGELAWAKELRNVGSIEYEGMPVVMGADGTRMVPSLIVPGYPEISTVLFRMTVRNRANPSEDAAYSKQGSQMPPLGVFEQDTVAIRWLTKWIKEMPPLSIHQGWGGMMAKTPPRLLGETIVLQAGFSGPVTITGVNGRQFELRRAFGNTYRIPSN